MHCMLVDLHVHVLVFVLVYVLVVVIGFFAIPKTHPRMLIWGAHCNAVGRWRRHKTGHVREHVQRT
ncbi:MAG: hypothetical protein ACR2L2_10225 [Acidobacteriota bacterium]